MNFVLNCPNFGTKLTLKHPILFKNSTLESKVKIQTYFVPLTREQFRPAQNLCISRLSGISSRFVLNLKTKIESLKSNDIIESYDTNEFYPKRVSAQRIGRKKFVVIIGSYNISNFVPLSLYIGLMGGPKNWPAHALSPIISAKPLPKSRKPSSYQSDYQSDHFFHSRRLLLTKEATSCRTAQP